MRYSQRELKETPAIEAQSADVGGAHIEHLQRGGRAFPENHPKGRALAGRMAALRARCVPMAHGLTRALPCSLPAPAFGRAFV
jgi:hypothetical protein